jgi:hypothetical protein
VNGKPVNMFFSEHSGGSAYEYVVVEKIGKRVNLSLKFRYERLY